MLFGGGVYAGSSFATVGGDQNIVSYTWLEVCNNTTLPYVEPVPPSSDFEDLDIAVSDYLIPAEPVEDWIDLAEPQEDWVNDLPKDSTIKRC